MSSFFGKILITQLKIDRADTDLPAHPSPGLWTVGRLMDNSKMGFK